MQLFLRVQGSFIHGKGSALGFFVNEQFYIFGIILVWSTRYYY